MSFTPDCRNCRSNTNVYKPFKGEQSPCHDCLDSGYSEVDGAPAKWVPINNITARQFAGDDDATVDSVKASRGLA